MAGEEPVVYKDSLVDDEDEHLVDDEDEHLVDDEDELLGDDEDELLGDDEDEQEPLDLSQYGNGEMELCEKFEDARML